MSHVWDGAYQVPGSWTGPETSSPDSPGQKCPPLCQPDPSQHVYWPYTHNRAAPVHETAMGPERDYINAAFWHAVHTQEHHEWRYERVVVEYEWYLCFIDPFNVWGWKVSVDLIDVLLIHVLWYTVLIKVVHHVGARQHAVHLKPKQFVKIYLVTITLDFKTFIVTAMLYYFFYCIFLLPFCMWLPLPVLGLSDWHKRHAGCWASCSGGHFQSQPTTCTDQGD